MLPCNVVVRALDETTTSVQAFDPAVMDRISDSSMLNKVSTDARTRLLAALETLTQEK